MCVAKYNLNRFGIPKFMYLSSNISPIQFIVTSLLPSVNPYKRNTILIHFSKSTHVIHFQDSNQVVVSVSQESTRGDFRIEYQISRSGTKLRNTEVQKLSQSPLPKIVQPLHLESHSISFSNLSRIGLFSTEHGKIRKPI